MNHPVFPDAGGSPARTAALLPVDDALRVELHNEVHARPQAHIRLPALISYVAVLNRDVSREDECAHLRLLPEQHRRPPSLLQCCALRLAAGSLH